MLLLRNFLSVAAGVLLTLGWYFGMDWISEHVNGWVKLAGFLLGACLTTLISTRYDLLHALIASFVAVFVLLMAKPLSFLNPSRSNFILIVLCIIFLPMLSYIGYFLGFYIKRKKLRP